MNNIHRTWLIRAEILLYLSFILIYPFVFIWFGLDYTDSPYHYLNFSGLRPAGPSTFLYSYIGNILCKITGNYILGYRTFAASITLITTALPCLLILRDYEWGIKLRFCAVAVIFATTMNYYIVNWDLFSYFIISLVFSFSWLYIKNHGLQYLVIIGSLGGIAMAFRLPNLTVLVPLVFLITGKAIIMRQKWTRAGIALMVMITCFAITYLLLYYFTFPNSGTGLNESVYASTFHDVIKPLGSAGSTYSLVALLYRYCANGLRIIEMLAVITMFILAWKHSKSFFINNRIISVFILVLFISYFIAKVLRSQYSYQLSFFYTAFTLLVFIALLHQAYNNKETRLAIFVVFSIILGFVASAGSNTGLLKISGVYIFMLPFGLAYIDRYLKRNDRQDFFLFIALICILSVAGKVFINETYEDGKIFRLTAEVKHQKLTGIRTTPARKQQIEDILYVTDSLKMVNSGRSVVFFGSKAWLFRYLEDTSPYIIHRFWLDVNSPDQIESLICYLEEQSNQPIVVMVYDYPEMPAYKLTDLMFGRMSIIGYKAVHRGNNYIIYIPG